MATKTNPETEIIIDGRRVVGAGQAARILTERAKADGYDRTYSRKTIHQKYAMKKLKAAVTSSAGNLYFVEDIEALKISPQRGRGNKPEEDQDAVSRETSHQED